MGTDLDTTFGLQELFIPLYGIMQNQKNQNPNNLYWSYVASGSNPLK